MLTILCLSPSQTDDIKMLVCKEGKGREVKRTLKYMVARFDNFLWNGADNEQNISVVAAELRAGEIHLHG